MPTTAHDRLRSAPEQREFPLRRKYTRKPSAATARPLSLRREQTLTQANFVRSSSARSRGTTDDSYQEDDGDYLESRPRKKAKRRRTERSASQTTVTQNWRNYREIYGECDHSRVDGGDDSHKADDTTDSDGALVSAEEYNHDLSQSSSTVKMSALNHGTFDYAEHLLSIASSARYPTALNSASSDVGSPSTRPTSAGSGMAFVTPRKPRRTVVPSSETPSTLYLSRQTSYTDLVCQSSPLTERSTNTASAKQRDPLPAAKGRCQTPENLETLGLKVEGDGVHEAARNSARTLQRATTIQDSDDDNIDIHDFESPSAEDAHRERQKNVPISRPMPHLRWATTIQESQAGSEAEELAAGSQQDDYDPIFQQTFDPVMTALDRDAARFGRSDTQFTALPEAASALLAEESGNTFHTTTKAPKALASQNAHSTASTQSEDSQSRETSPGLKGGSKMRTIEPAGNATLSRGLELGTGRAWKTRRRGQTARWLSGGDCIEPEEDSTESAITHEWAGDDVHVPPNSRALDQDGDDVIADSPTSSLHSQVSLEAEQFMEETDRIPQSQISTVMPTQLSRPGSPHGHQPAPQQSVSTIATDMPSSSPFPLPPRTSSGYGLGVATQDFSLPPPPQLSSPVMKSLENSM